MPREIFSILFFEPLFFDDGDLPMRILHILDVSWPIERGYSIRGFYITRNQKLLGLEPVILTSERQYAQNFYISYNGIKHYRSANGNNSPSILPFFREFGAVIRLKRRICQIVRTEQIDIIHAHSPCLWGLSALWAGRELGKRVIYEVRAFWEDAAVDAGKYREGSIVYRLSRQLETLVAKNAYKVVAICQGIRSDLVSRDIPDEKIIVVPNGIDINEFKPIEKSKELLDEYDLKGKLVCGFIGSMFNFEGIELLVHAASAIKEKVNNLRIILVGEGQKFDTVRKLVESEKLDNIVSVVGKVPHDEVKKYYSVIDFFVYPRISKRITELVTPLKPLEAMAMGKAVLVSDVGGLKELISDEQAGVVFRSGSVSDLSDKICSMYAAPEKAISVGKRARRTMERYRDWKTIVSLYIEKVYV